MKFIFIYKLSSEAQKFNFSLAWFFLFKSNHYFWFVWELVWLSLSYMKSKRPPNFHSTSSAALGLTCLFQEALRLQGWWCTPSYPRTQEQMPSARFWPGHQWICCLPHGKTIYNWTRALLHPQTGKSPPRALTFLG